MVLHHKCRFERNVEDQLLLADVRHAVLEQGFQVLVAAEQGDL